MIRNLPSALGWLLQGSSLYNYTNVNLGLVSHSDPYLLVRKMLVESTDIFEMGK